MIYVHIPFCHRKCTYCAFYSLGAQGGDVQRRYVDALLDEMRRRRGEQRTAVRTVYFGGGTPSLLPVAELGRLVEGLRGSFDLSQVEEATLECNPEDLADDRLEALAGLGFFNRISIGLQSLDDRQLRLLGRRHTARQAVGSVRRARAAGFGNISVDFMYGLPLLEPPAQDVEALAEVLALATHVSAYALTVEPRTALEVQVRQMRVALPDDDEVVRQYHAMRARLAEAGFEQYEVSNYARPGCHSRHNSRYWDRTPYLGLGAAAHSFDGRRRRWNLGDVQAYIDSHPYEEELLTEADAVNELLMTALRTVRGLDLAQVPEPHRADLLRRAKPYLDCGWLTVAPPPSSLLPHHSSLITLRPTPEGLLHADGMAAALFV